MNPVTAFAPFQDATGFLFMVDHSMPQLPMMPDTWTAPPPAGHGSLYSTEPQMDDNDYEDERDTVEHIKEEDSRKAMQTSAKPKSRKRNRDTEKRVKCTDCEKTFSRHEHMVRHRHNRNQYRCDHAGCSFESPRSDLLTRHIKRHKDDKSRLRRAKRTGSLRPTSAIQTATRQSTTAPASYGEAGHPPVWISPQAEYQNAMSLDEQLLHRQQQQYERSLSTPYVRVPVAQMLSSYPEQCQPRRISTESLMENHMSDYSAHGPSLPFAPNSGSLPYPIAQVQPSEFHPPMNLLDHTLESSQNLAVYDLTSEDARPPDKLHIDRTPPLVPHSLASSSSDTGSSRANSQQSSVSPMGRDGISEHRTPLHTSSRLPRTMLSAESEHDPFFHHVLDDTLSYHDASYLVEEMFEPDAIVKHEKHENQNPRVYPRYRAPPMENVRAEESAEPKTFESVISSDRYNALLKYISDFPKSGPTEIMSYQRGFKEALHVRMDRYTEGAGRTLTGPDQPRYYQAHLRPEVHRRMLEEYLSSFWNHVHHQLPIVHRPTFSPDTCPDEFLLTILALGASSLDWGTNDRNGAAAFASFLAWHVRGRVMDEADALQPAKAWIFQTLLLLELFEKLYSSRDLHRRADMQHASTVTLLRRGASLVGRLKNEQDKTWHAPAPDGSINTAGYNTRDSDWNHWISAELENRIACATFYLDTTHSAMFGFDAVMKVNEMQVDLPCDESMWNARSHREIKMIAKSTKHERLSFVQGVMKTLHGVQVSTSLFGRASILAGLLGIRSHMKMKDNLFRSKQGVTDWKGKLSHGIQHWNDNFKAQLDNDNKDEKKKRKSRWTWLSPYDVDKDPNDTTRNVLFTVAIMAVNCELRYCEIFAGASIQLGRKVTDKQWEHISRLMRETWARGSEGRVATFHALRLLTMMFKEKDLETLEDRQIPDSDASLSMGFRYSAPDDYLLNRPWTMYYAAMVVWSYGFALDGPLLTPPPDLTTVNGMRDDMDHFLEKFSQVNTPDDLQYVRGRNECVGMLVLLRRSFQGSRWQLLHDSAPLLDKCINALVGELPIVPGSDSVQYVGETGSWSQTHV